MEGELHNLILDWSLVLASLLYCHVVGMFIAKGTTRFLALFPVICLFVLLPRNLTTMFYCGLTSFFITWLANFKLIVYAFGQGPLSANPPLPLSHFVFSACFPINIMKNHKNTKNTKSLKEYAPRVLLFLITLKANSYIDRLHPFITAWVYAYILFFMLEFLLAMIASLVRTIVGVELEPQFDEPHHASSVQNFWGKRWNLMVSSILRPSVYLPARDIFIHVVPERWVSVPAVFSTFLVSGIVHELIFYYLDLRRMVPTGELTCFFIVQGAWVGIEIVMKKKFGQKFEPPLLVARILTLGFVIVTGIWFFFPPFLRIDPYGRSCRETMAFLGFLTSGKLRSPSEYVCPLM